MRQRYEQAPTFEAFLATATAQQEMWQQVRRRATVPPDLLERARAIPGRWHLLALVEDWCGDAFNTIPVVAALADQVEALDLRLLRRDANPDLMDAHLSGTARSIPVVMLLDGAYRERGWWGPRPAPLQTWFLSTAQDLPKAERYREIRRFYARDRGRTTLDEIVRKIERAAEAEGA